MRISYNVLKYKKSQNNITMMHSYTFKNKIYIFNTQFLPYVNSTTQNL